MEAVQAPFLIAAAVAAAGIAALREAGHTVISMKLISVAQNVSVINDLETAKAALRLYEALDDYDDALNVFSNFDVAEEILEQLG